MSRYDIMDTREEFGNWSISDKKIHKEHPFDWRRSIVYRGKKSECISWIKQVEDDKLKFREQTTPDFMYIGD